MSTATIFYTMEGEEGEDSTHPNLLRCPYNKVLRMSDFIQSFPIQGIYKYEFKVSNKESHIDAPCIWLHIDHNDLDAEIPPYNGNFFANVIDLSRNNHPTLYSDEEEDEEVDYEDNYIDIPKKNNISSISNQTINNDDWNAFNEEPDKKVPRKVSGDRDYWGAGYIEEKLENNHDEDNSIDFGSWGAGMQENKEVVKTKAKKEKFLEKEDGKRGNKEEKKKKIVETPVAPRDDEGGVAMGGGHNVGGTSKSLFSGVSSWAKSTVKSTTQWAKEGGGKELAKKITGIAAGVASNLLERTSKSYTIRGEQVNEIRKIAEGGFSVVYLVKHADSEDFMALKKIICQSRDSEKEALEEARIHGAVNHPNLLTLIAFDVQPSEKGPWNQVLLLFPFYPAGSVFDIAWAVEEANTKREANLSWPFPEEIALRIFISVCRGAQAFHKAGFVHRDIKPHNILMSGEKGVDLSISEPVLMDLGSYGPVNVQVKSRSHALLIQDEAASKCSLAYRAPELFDVPSSCTLNEGRDVWSLGCTLYSMAFGWSPFENATEGVKTLAIISGDVVFPTNNQHFDAKYSLQFEKLIKWILNPDPKERPSMKEVISKSEKLYASIRK